MMIPRQMPRQRFVPRRSIPADLVERLRHDPAWSEAVLHLEQGMLGLGIRYKEESQKDNKVEQELRDQIDDLKSQVRDLRSKMKSDSSNLETDMDAELKKMEIQMRELAKPKPKAAKPCAKPSDRTSIQVSRDFKSKLKAIKGSRSYEDVLRERMGSLLFR